MREAQAAAALDHPNICTVHEFDEAEEKSFISMAYIEGQNLKTKVESGPIEIDEALRIATQVAEGLQEAHEKGVVHRDIKSANIMVTGKGQAKIMDFGLARVRGGAQITKEATTMGTVAYMSPEQARGKDVDHRTDIWSFGVVLYEMFTGQLPFKGNNEQAVVYSILNEGVEPLEKLRPTVSEELQQIVFRTLEKDPEKRYQSAHEVLQHLKKLSDRNEGTETKTVEARELLQLLKRPGLKADSGRGVFFQWDRCGQHMLVHIPNCSSSPFDFPYFRSIPVPDRQSHTVLDRSDTESSNQEVSCNNSPL